MVALKKRFDMSFAHARWVKSIRSHRYLPLAELLFARNSLYTDLWVKNQSTERLIFQAAKPHSFSGRRLIRRLGGLVVATVYRPTDKTSKTHSSVLRVYNKSVSGTAWRY